LEEWEGIEINLMERYFMKSSVLIIKQKEGLELDDEIYFGVHYDEENRRAYEASGCQFWQSRE
jgi:hypothetical protein